MQQIFRDKLHHFISDYFYQYGLSPSFNEITDAMEISPSSKSLIARNLRQLAKEGKLVLSKQGKRLMITLPARRLVLLGKISAGSPIEAILENETVDIMHMLEGKDRFALLVSGSSMIDEGILDGDIIFCKQSEVAKEGDIVVALIDQRNATLKRISYKVEGMITLIPANPDLKPEAYVPARVAIQGIYIGLVRKHR